MDDHLFRFKFLLLTIVAAILLKGCSAFFETDIGDEMVRLIAPADSIRTVIVSQTFWWDYLEDANRYNLQIVSPSFSEVERVVIDTNLTADRFQTILTPGVYEWRVRAYNSCYSTPYSTNVLIIDSTLDLSEQVVILKNPPSYDAKNTTDIEFQWYPIYNALSYRFEIRKGSWTGEPVILPVDTTGYSLSLILDEGSYVWAVKAINNISGSAYTTRDLIVDTTSPLIHELTSPEPGKSFNGLPIQLIWNRTDTKGSAIFDSIYISTDSTEFINAMLEKHRSNNTYYNITFSDEGDYYWRIRSFDAAGNQSDLSEIRKFIIKSDQ